MQDLESNNEIILPKKRPRNTNDLPSETEKTVFLLSSENFFRLCTGLSGETKLFWTLPTSPIQLERPEDTQIESSLFSTSDQEEWRLKFIQSPDEGLLSIRLENIKAEKSQKKVRVAGSVSLWAFLGRRYENLCRIKLEHFFSDEVKVWETSGFLDVIKLKRIRKHVMVEVCFESWPDPEYSKLATGFVGIIDDGLLGFVNCFIQTLFHLKSFQKDVLQAGEELSPALKTLKALFYDLKCSNFAVSSSQFIKTLELREEKVWKGENFDCLYVIEQILMKVTKDERFENRVLSIFEGTAEKKVVSRGSKFVSTCCENFTEICLSVDNCLNIYESFEKLLGENAFRASESEEFVNDEKRTVKFVNLPDVLILVLDRTAQNRPFEYYSELDLTKFTLSGLTQKFQLFSQIIKNSSVPSKYQTWIFPPNTNLRFENDLVSHFSLNSISLTSGQLIDSYEMQESGLIKSQTQNPLVPKVLIYLKSEKVSENLQDFIYSSLVPPTLKDFPKGSEQDSVTEIPIVGLDMLLEWDGPGVLPSCTSSNFLSYCLQLVISKKIRGRELRTELSTYISEDYRLWTFTPGNKNWEFKELKLNDLVFTDPLRAIFIEVIIQKPIFQRISAQWRFSYNFDTSTKASFENEVTDENLEMLTPSSAKAIVFYKWYDWNSGQPTLKLFKMVTLTSTSNMSQIRQDLFSTWQGSSESAKMVLHLEKCKVLEYKNKESLSHVYSYRADENYELTISKRGSFGVRHVIIDNGDAFIGERLPDVLPENYIDAKKFIAGALL